MEEALLLVVLIVLLGLQRRCIKKYDPEMNYNDFCIDFFNLFMENNEDLYFSHHCHSQEVQRVANACQGF